MAQSNQKAQKSTRSSTAARSSKAARSPGAKKPVLKAEHKTAAKSSGTSSASKKRTTKKNKDQTKQLAMRALRGVLLIIIGAFILLCLFIDSMGAVGSTIKTVLMGITGGAAYTIPFFLIYSGILLIMRETHKGIRVKTVAFIIIVCMLAAFIHNFTPYSELTGTFGERAAAYYASGGRGISGGFIGGIISGEIFMPLLGKTGSVIVVVIILIVALMLLTNVTPVTIYKFIKQRGEKKAIRDREDMEIIKRREAEKKERETKAEIRRREEAAVRPQRPQPQARIFHRKQTKRPQIDIGLEDDYKFTPLSDEMVEAVKRDRNVGGEEKPKHKFTNLSTEEFDAKVAEFSKKAAEAKKIEAMESELAAREAQSELEAAAHLSGASATAQDGAALKETKPAEAEKPKAVSPAPAAPIANLKENGAQPEAPPAPVYVYPPITLLKQDLSQSSHDVSAELRSTATKLVETLNSFNVSTQIVDVSRGPTVTRYELQPNAGVKVSKIVNLSDDIALNLATAGVRIEAPIPGKAAVGIEVPNRVTSNVYLRDIITSPEFIQQKSRLTFALGKDVSGSVMVGDIAKMPHMLIAGSTGSGKSVCINSMIMSLLYKSTPEEVRLLLIDPKVVELGVYNSIPHLIIPVVTDPKKAAGALRWAVNEMLGRYKLFAENNVRDLKSYNEAIAKKGDPALKPLPRIVIIIDELADLMMAAPNEVEDSICRLAQMARAAGMHLVIATQRPSVDVITGLIKANINSRISFAVSSQIDSRTILDMGGAEKLLGKGDMLYLPMGAPKPVRIQGCFVSDEEIEAVVDFIKQSQQKEVTYDQTILDDIEKESIIGQKGKGGAHQSGGEDGDDADEMLEAAIEIVVEAEMASVSLLQRKLKLGYARAARIVDQMEQRGVVGPYEGSKPRKVLMTKQEFMEKKMANNDW
ncbi:MAG: DNA translocase FtsK [Clostridia bacterium]|nr:DNA translocase FtsK [Clostridia bacterium]